MADAQNPNDELYPIAVLMDELKVANPAQPLPPHLLTPRLPSSSRPPAAPRDPAAGRNEEALLFTDDSQAR